MMNLLQEEKIKNSSNNTIILLKLISYMILTTEDLEDHVNDLLYIVKNYEKILIDNDEGLVTVEKIAITLINRLQHYNYDSFIKTVFSILLNVQATRSLPKEEIEASHRAMENLAKKAGYGTVAELHSQ